MNKKPTYIIAIVNTLIQVFCIYHISGELALINSIVHTSNLKACGFLTLDIGCDCTLQQRVHSDWVTTHFCKSV